MNTIRRTVLGQALLLASAFTGHAALAQEAAPAPPPVVRKFDINEIDVEGNTVLSQLEIERALEPFLGPERTTADIESARAALEKAYATHGFQTVYVAIPQQTVRGGVVRLRAVEARIGRVDVKGVDEGARERIRAGVPTLAEGAVPNVKELNAQLVRLNSRRAGLQVTPQMTPGTQPQTIDVGLDVSDEFPMHGSIELNNRYSRDTHQLRLQANVSYDDLWHAQHSLGLLYSVPPQARDDGEVYALTYTAPLSSSGARLSVTALNSNSNIAAVGTSGVLGKGRSFTATASLPLGGIDSYSHYLQGSWAYKHFENIISLEDQSDSAPITYYPLSITYGASYQGEVNRLTFDTGLTFSLRGLGSDRAAYDYSRFRADGNFAYWHAGFTWMRALPLGFELFGEVVGQRGNGPLVSNEQFSIGGDGSVRGYLQSEAVGDEGVRGSLEVRSPSVAPLLGESIDELRLVFFTDGARASLRDPLPEQQHRFVMSSAGLGLTAQAFGGLHASVFYAHPFLNASGITRPGERRVQFRAFFQF